VNLVVEGVWVAGIEIDEGGNLLGMAGTDGAELFASDGVSDENGIVEVEGVDDGKDVVTEAVCLGGGSGRGGSAEAAAGDSVDVVVGGEFGSEFVPYVGAVGMEVSALSIWRMMRSF
jgi:hypothetical protein